MTGRKSLPGLRAIILSVCLLVGTFTTTFAAPAREVDLPAQVGVSSVDTSHYPRVVLAAKVVDANGMPVVGLTAANFTVVDDGRVVPVTSVSPGTTEPSSLAVVVGLDVSGSMSGRPLSDAIDTITAFVGQLGPSDLAGAVLFGGAQCNVDPGPALSTAKDPVNAFLRGARAGGWTPLYDALMIAIQKASSAPPGQRLVVFMTDGEDTCSHVSLDTVVAAATRSSVPLTFIGLGPELKQSLLQRLAALTGGEYYSVDDSSQLKTAYDELSVRLRTRYAIEFNSANPPDGRPHALEVGVRTRSGVVMQETQYLVPSHPFTVMLSAQPNPTIDRPTSFTVSSSDNQALASATFFLDDQPIPASSTTDARFGVILAPTTLSGGRHLLAVRAEDASGRQADATESVEFGRPRLSLSNPASQSMTKPTTITVGLEPLVPLARVDFSVDDNLVASSFSAPFGFTFDPAKFAPGGHLITARAFDQAGTEAETSVSIAIPGAPVQTPPPPPAGGFPLWAVVAVVLAIPLAAWAGTATRRPLPRRCPNCGRVQQREWVMCPFCDVPQENDPTSDDPPAIPLDLSDRAAWLVADGAPRRPRYRLNPDRTTLGRDASNDIVLADRAVSRHHAAIDVVDGFYVISDLAAANGVVVQSRRVERARLSPGDVVAVGRTKLRFQIEDDPAPGRS